MALKEGEVAIGAEAAREIRKLIPEMLIRGNDGEDDSDPFASSDEELEKNEFVVYNDYVILTSCTRTMSKKHPTLAHVHPE